MDRPRLGAGDGENGPGAVSPGPSPSLPDATARSPAPDSFRVPTGPLPRADPDGRVDADPPEEILQVARAVFADRLTLAVSFAGLLVTEGVVRGLIGPREAPRIWERHLINCAVMSEMIPKGASVVDVGSGTGLPGIVLAVARPDLSITLVEPLARRTAFLSETVDALGLDPSVTVVRGRAEDLLGTLPPVDVVTARAVAPLDRLAGWCLPLTTVGGRLLALKGASASDEVAEHRAAVQRLGGSEPVVRLCGVGTIDPPTTVVEIVRERSVVPPASRPSKRAAGSGRSTSGTATGRRRPRRG